MVILIRLIININSSVSCVPYSEGPGVARIRAKVDIQSNDLLQFKIHSGIDLIIFHEFVI